MGRVVFLLIFRFGFGFGFGCGFVIGMIFANARALLILDEPPAVGAAVMLAAVRISVCCIAMWAIALVVSVYVAGRCDVVIGQAVAWWELAIDIVERHNLSIVCDADLSAVVCPLNLP